jgi:hypothetical protein
LIRDNRWFKILGYNTFEQWVESPDIDIDRSSAYRYIRLYEVYVESGAFELSEIQDKSVSKLEILIPYVDPTSDNWRKRKKELLGYLDLPRAELVKHLNNALDDRRYGNGRTDKNAQRGMAIQADVKIDEGKLEKLRQADDEFERATKVERRSEPERSIEEVSDVQTKKKLGLSGWYELVPMKQPPERGIGRVIEGVYITTEQVVVQGNRIFVNVE